MMTRTYGDIRTELETELDLQEEDFITPSELLGYYNAAVEDAQAEIHGIYEDYFLTSAPVAIVQGTANYALPANIYANKIRSLVFNDGSRIYSVPRLRSEREFTELSYIQMYSPGINSYSYLLRNDSAASGIMIQLVPAAQATTATAMTIWYLREANRATSDSDICDIPEFWKFIKAHMKRSCLTKEGRGQPPQFIVDELEAERKQMVETLSARVPDDDNKIIPDFSLYEDMA